MGDLVVIVWSSVYVCGHGINGACKGSCERHLSSCLRQGVDYSMFIMMISTQFMRLGMLSNVAAVAMMAPILLEMAPLLKMNPVSFTLLISNLHTFAFVIPTQITAAVIAYGTSAFSMSDYAKVGLPIMLIAILWSIFVMAPWYALNGFPVWSPLIH